ncbi:MAG: DUF711 family protein [Candidatus Aminicenantes bacterium]|jgi:uncharacterized protein (UPF0210 family)
MKIRTITTGFNLKPPLREKQVQKIAFYTQEAKKAFAKAGFFVQTIRVATQPWEEYFSSRRQIVGLAKRLEGLTIEHGIDYFNMGTTRNTDNIPLVYDLIKNTTRGFCTVHVCDDRTINTDAALQAARIIKKLSVLDKDGFTNLRFAAIFNTKPGSPFYPGAFHKGPVSFAVGTENSDLVYKAFSRSKDIGSAGAYLKRILNSEFKKIEKVGKRLQHELKIKYGGIDVSIASSVKATESIAFAFEKLGLGKFGDPGTLTVAKSITDTLRDLNVKTCGYCGLMLPVLEDYGLARRNREGRYDLINLLTYSAVCGTGLDTIPLPGNVSEKKLYALLLDIASLSQKLNKPLSARLMPVPGKKAGEMTEFTFEYFANSKIMKL